MADLHSSSSYGPSSALSSIQVRAQAGWPSHGALTVLKISRTTPGPQPFMMIPLFQELHKLGRCVHGPCRNHPVFWIHSVLKSLRNKVKQRVSVRYNDATHGRIAHPIAQIHAIITCLPGLLKEALGAYSNLIQCGKWPLWALVGSKQCLQGASAHDVIGFVEHAEYASHSQHGKWRRDRRRWVLGRPT
ncbi:hypothetical protein B0T21DRAFT_393236 [Apiosordaria backusii]|uniref:Uncharacterized protein n=1 Tax=Apiosordaria backusii TaxID=314023 RepID=A0AA40BLX3_9PEZI|nr:hypothetical protein B0T21DRAFT_393236 [Apiosordaria backusii]